MLNVNWSSSSGMKCSQVFLLKWASAISSLFFHSGILNASMLNIFILPYVMLNFTFMCLTFSLGCTHDNFFSFMFQLIICLGCFLAHMLVFYFELYIFISRSMVLLCYFFQVWLLLTNFSKLIFWNKMKILILHYVSDDPSIWSFCESEISLCDFSWHVYVVCVKGEILKDWLIWFWRLRNSKMLSKVQK